MYSTNIYERSQTSYTTRLMASSAMGLNLGVFGFLPTTHPKAMCSRSLRVARRFTHVWLHVQTAVHASNTRTWLTTIILITGKTRRPPIWAPWRDQDGAGSGISGVYICDVFIKYGFSEILCCMVGIDKNYLYNLYVCMTCIHGNLVKVGVNPEILKSRNCGNFQTLTIIYVNLKVLCRNCKIHVFIILLTYSIILIYFSVLCT